MSTAMTFTPQHSSPLARPISPSKEPRHSPCTPENTPGKTAQLWDEYQRQAMEGIQKRDMTSISGRRQTRQSSRGSSGTVLDIIKSYDPHSSPRVPSLKGSPQFDFHFPTRRQPQLRIESTTVAICKTCREPVTSNLGLCEACKKTIVLTSSPGAATPPVTPATRSFPSTAASQVEEDASFPNASPPSTSPTRACHHWPPAQLIDPPIRLSSLRPPAHLQSTPRSSLDAPRPRKASLPGPSESSSQLISRKPVRFPAPQPITPPPTSHSHASAPRTRPCSLANITTPPTTATAAYRFARHTSATPSELSTLFPYTTSPATTSPPSVCRASYQLQNTTSAWEDSDSEDEEKVGLVGYWRGRRWRGSRGSRGSMGSHAEQARRDSASKEEEGRRADGGKKRLGFVRVLSCGCRGD